MTVCVMVKVSEGLVLAADSAATIIGRFGDDQGVLKTFEHSRKVSHVKDYPIGTLSWGASSIGSRSVESLIKEYEYRLPSLAEEEEKGKEKRSRGEAYSPFTYSVREIAQGLLQHIQTQYAAEYETIDAAQRPFLGVLIAGFSSGQYFPEHWLFELPQKPELINVRPDQDGKPVFGAHWYGLTDAITRLHWGRDDHAIQLLTERFGVAEKEVFTLLEPLQYMVPFAGMPLQDAIDYAVYLVNVVIGRYRFVIGAPVCGGEVLVAVITPGNFTWIRRDAWKVS
jgi:hypothetical protein